MYSFLILNNSIVFPYTCPSQLWMMFFHKTISESSDTTGIFRERKCYDIFLTLYFVIVFYKLGKLRLQLLLTKI